jgi:hypothetical protein
MHLGLNPAVMYDENFKHNGIFAATLIKDENKAVAMFNYLVS